MVKLCVFVWYDLTYVVCGPVAVIHAGTGWSGRVVSLWIDMSAAHSCSPSPSPSFHISPFPTWTPSLFFCYSPYSIPFPLPIILYPFFHISNPPLIYKLIPPSPFFGGSLLPTPPSPGATCRNSLPLLYITVFIMSCLHLFLSLDHRR